MLQELVLWEAPYTHTIYSEANTFQIAHNTVQCQQPQTQSNITSAYSCNELTHKRDLGKHAAKHYLKIQDLGKHAAKQLNGFKIQSSMQQNN